MRLSASEYEKAIADLKAREKLGESDAVLSADAVEASKKLTGRECGECSLCCKLLKIETSELVKPSGKWCHHCRPGRGGCSIYDARPDICKGFACVWLLNSSLSEAWKPSRSKIVVQFAAGDGAAGVSCTFIVDPTFPNRWREEPYYRDIKKISLFLLNPSDPDEREFATVVKTGRRAICVLPRKEVDVTGLLYMVKMIGTEWEVLSFKNETDGRRFCDEMAKAYDTFKSLPPHKRALMDVEMQKYVREKYAVGQMGE